jgi:MacB-like periplasmic core domain
MNWLSQLARRLLMLFRHRQFHADLEEEMRLHRELREHEKIAEGLTPKEARYTAKRRFGNELVLREQGRDMWGWNWLETLLQDVRYGLRQLRRNPGFTAVAVLTLALGIGANTAIFSLIDAVMLRTLPVEKPGKLFKVQFGDPQSGGEASSFTNPMWEQVRNNQNVFSSAFAWSNMDPLDLGESCQLHHIATLPRRALRLSTLTIHSAARNSS